MIDNKVIITVAPTGAWPSKQDNPNIPLQPKEIAEEVYACWMAGAAVAHIHVRDDNNKSSMNFDKFVETVEYIRATDCDIILNLTTSGQLGLKDERMKHLITLKPEMASYDCGSITGCTILCLKTVPGFREAGIGVRENSIKPGGSLMQEWLQYFVLFKRCSQSTASLPIVWGAPVV